MREKEETSRGRITQDEPQGHCSVFDNKQNILVRAASPGALRRQPEKLMSLGIGPLTERRRMPGALT